MHTHTDTEFLDVLSPDGFVATHRIAEVLGCTRPTANRRLTSLAEAGAVEVYDPDEEAVLDEPKAMDTSRLLAFRLLSEEEATT